MVETLINLYTIEHLIFGLGTALIISFLSRSRHRVPLVSMAIVVLWEIFEYRNSSSYWMSNIGNNLMDIFVGLVGIIIMLIIINIAKKVFKIM